MPLRDLRPQQARRSAEDLVAHLKRFTLVPKFSVGIWYFSPFAGRFHDKYASEVPLEARLEAVARLRQAGVDLPYALSLVCEYGRLAALCGGSGLTRGDGTCLRTA